MVQLSCGVQFTRAALFALNVLVLLIGFSVMGVGIYVKVNGNFRAISEIYSISEALGAEVMQWASLGMIIGGVFTAGLATFGCLGAVLKNRCFLYAYSISLILIILFEFGVVIATLVFRENLWKTYDSGFMDVFRYAYNHNQTETIQMIENLEREFKCCGVDGPSDYRRYGYKIPLSCYPGQPLSHLPYNDGCAAAVILWVWKELPIIAGVLGSILFIEIFGVISSLVLGVAVSHSSHAVRYTRFSEK